uniref:Fibronectin type-III domain-containing protein n=1 Tax=Amphimedon queenslandica TaxID=400682 RepID=A0A1X7T973_AMPQE
MYMFTVYLSVPLITPPVSVVPVIDGQQISLNITINVSTICKGEYPNSITVNILNTNNTVINNTIIPTQVNDQLMIVTGSTAMTNLINTLTINVSLSNNGGTFKSISSIGFNFLGPVTNIDSSIDNCSIIDITWTAPTVDDRVPIKYYILRIYDAITSGLVKNVSVYDTRYQFVADNLLIHRYTYVITGVNDLGEGISNIATFSYQRVPSLRAIQNTSLNTLSYIQDGVIIQFYIPITLTCTGEAPEQVTVTAICNGTDSSTTYLIKQIKIITGLISVPQYQQCNISIVFVNEAGSSEPFMLSIDKYPLSSTNINVATTVKISPTTTVSTSFNISTVIAATSLGVVVILLLLIIISLIVLVITYKRKAYRFASLQQQKVPTARNEAYEFNTLMNTFTNQPAYEEIRGNKEGAVNM